MRFERKIFIAVFCTTLVIGSLLIWAGHKYASDRSRDEFISRYSVFTRVLADTLTRLDTSTETLMMNAAQVIAARDAQKGLLSTAELKSMRESLGVTHIFMVNKDGSFIRSTNEDPRLIPNLYSFCDDYRKLLTGGRSSDATPVIKPRPEPKPYKFLFIPNVSKQRIVEVGVRVDSIAKTLVEAIKADKNVISMHLYSPDGRSFGEFSSKDVVLDDATVQLPENLNVVKDIAAGTHFFAKVVSSHPQCCQCNVSGSSKNGEYYYVLESTVSKAELSAVQARMAKTFVLLALGNLLLAFLVAKLLSRRLVRNIRTAVTRVRAIKEGRRLDDRIRLDGPDEVAFLTREFDRLLDVIQESQKRVVEAEKAESKVQLARVVAHNIKSPLVAIEMMIPQMLAISDRTRRILTNSVSEMRELADKLRNKPEAVEVQASGVSQIGELVFLPLLLDEVVGQKQIEYSRKNGMEIAFSKDARAMEAWAKVNSFELRSIISNLINNGIESYGGDGGRVDVALSVPDGFCTITVTDQGCGVPSEYLKDLGRKQVTFKGGNGRGLGLIHAMQMIESWGGVLEFKSELGTGTITTIRLKKFESRRPDEPTSLAEVGH
jgi:signal transduction histidine kinase